jgi:hypothetical protein
MTTVKQIVIIYVIFMCLSTLGFWFFNSVMHLSERWNIISGVGTIVATLIALYITVRINAKNEQLKEIKTQQIALEEEVRAKVDYEKTYLPKMVDLDKRIGSKADSVTVDSLRDRLNEVNNIIDDHFHDIDKNLDARFAVMDKNLGDRFSDMKTFITKRK